MSQGNYPPKHNGNNKSNNATNNVLQNPRLLKILRVDGNLVCVSGVRVGASRESLEIGGIDNPVIRHPITKFPYIPGSSLKGKMRSLLESVDGKGQGGNPCGCAQSNCRVCKFFGPHKKPRHELNPSRFLFRDAILKESYQVALAEAYQEFGLFFVETKSENTIDRRTSVAGSPRSMERVPAGTQFDFQLDIRVYEGDSEIDIRETVEQMFHLLAADAIGSGGTRGSGQVRIEDVQFHDIDIKGNSK